MRNDFILSLMYRRLFSTFCIQGQVSLFFIFDLNANDQTDFQIISSTFTQAVHNTSNHAVVYNL